MKILYSALRIPLFKLTWNNAFVSDAELWTITQLPASDWYYKMGMDCG